MNKNEELILRALKHLLENHNLEIHKIYEDIKEALEPKEKEMGYENSLEEVNDAEQKDDVRSKE